MRWSKRGRSRNLEDRRTTRTGVPMGRRGAGLGIGGVLLLIVLSLVFKQDFLSMFVGAGAGGGGIGGTQTGSRPMSAAEEAAQEELVQFVSFVLDDNQETWTRLLPEMGGNYRDAKLVLFRDIVRSACGMGQAASGPFYCPGDQKVYIDLVFYKELRDRFGAPGDFAQAYVISHEIGHHVQNLLGIEPKVRQLQRRNPGQANELSVRMELQADCLAGVWGHWAARRNILEQGDLEEGLSAAAAIGDDRIQRMSGRAINPDAFTHGSSAQRVDWFRRGFRSGKPGDCETF